MRPYGTAGNEDEDGDEDEDEDEDGRMGPDPVAKRPFRARGHRALEPTQPRVRRGLRREVPLFTSR
jgi:hypothetical protein